MKPKRKSAERRSPRGERRFEPYGPPGLNSLNRRMGTRMYGGVAGESGRPLPQCRLTRPPFPLSDRPVSLSFAPPERPCTADGLPPQPVIAHVGTGPSVRIDSFQTVTVLSVLMVEENARLAILGSLRLPPLSLKSPDVAPSIACSNRNALFAGHRLRGEV